MTKAAADWATFLEVLAKEDIDPGTIDTEQALCALVDEVWPGASTATKSRIRTHWRTAIHGHSGGGTGTPPPPAPAAAMPLVTSSSLVGRMFDDSVSASVPLPPANLFGPSYIPVAARECLRDVGLWNHDSVIAWCERFVDEHVDWRGQGVTRDQALAITLYTYDMGVGHAHDNIYTRVNRTLRERKPDEVVKWRHFIWHMVSGLRALPAVSCVVFRGIDVSMADKHTKGKHISWNSFVSTTTAEDTAKDFMKSVTCGTFFQITAKWGRNIKAFSPFGDREDEVLLEPNSEFEVTAAANFGATGTISLVTMVQVPSRSPLIPEDMKPLPAATTSDLAEKMTHAALDGMDAKDWTGARDWLVAALAVDGQFVPALMLIRALRYAWPSVFKQGDITINEA
jgi:hypothetical protein